MIWLRFKKHKIAVLSLVLLLILYVVSIFAEFFTPYDIEKRFPGFENAEPSTIYLFDENNEYLGFHFYEFKKTVDRETFEVKFIEDKTKPVQINFFTRGANYDLLGFIPTNLKFYYSEKPFFLFGGDRLGRDLYTRTMIGMRISLFIGLGGVFFSFVLGCLFGGISGYFGGFIDNIIQRMIDVLLSIPTIPLWMALAAAIPRDWTVLQTYFAITMVLAIVGWAGLARVVRGKLLALREEDYILAAQIAGRDHVGCFLREVRRNAMESAAFRGGLFDHRNIPRNQIAESTMNHLGTATRSAAGEILSLDQRHGKASQRRITGDAGSSDTAANHQ